MAKIYSTYICQKSGIPKAATIKGVIKWLMSKFLIAKYHFTFIGETFHRLKATGQNHYGILEYSLKNPIQL